MLKKHTHNKAILRGPFVSGKILIIDRDIENTKSLIDCFEAEHFTVKLVDNSQQAMNQVLSYLPEIILLDIEFPDTSGLDIFRAILLDKQTESIPTIILTAKAEPIDRIVGLELGAEDYLYITRSLWNWREPGPDFRSSGSRSRRSLDCVRYLDSPGFVGSRLPGAWDGS